MSTKIIPVALPPPSKLVLRTQSPTRGSSRSPGRGGRSPSRAYYEYYRDISPNSLLRALTASIDSSVPKPIEKLIESIRNASPTQKQFATNAAETLKNLKLWCEELDSWHWPGSFDVPAQTNESKQSLPSIAHTTNSDESSYTLKADDETNAVLWGSLPMTVVMAYEQRLEAIADDLEALHIGDQRALVLENHVHSNGPSFKESSSTDQLNSLQEYSHLDDLTALTTLNVLQALPWYAHLISTMNGWSSRIFVLKHVPDFQSRLRQVQTLMTRADTSRELSSGNEADTWREDVRAQLEDHLNELGQVLDDMLDAISGMQETLPEHWIDAFEHFESTFVTWNAPIEDEGIPSAEDESAKLQVVNVEVNDALVHSLPPSAKQASSLPTFQTQDEITTLTSGGIIGKIAGFSDAGVPRREPSDGDECQLPNSDNGSATNAGGSDKTSTQASLNQLSNDRKSVYSVDGCSSVQSLVQTKSLHPEHKELPTNQRARNHPGIGAPTDPLSSPEMECISEKDADVKNELEKTSYQAELSSPEQLGTSIQYALIEDGFPTTEDPAIQATTHASISSHRRSFTVDQQLERCINDILLQMPTRIEFNPEAVIATAQEQRIEKDTIRGRSSHEQSAADATGTDPKAVLTLTAATVKDSRSARSGNSSQIKLFYLTRPGKDKPVKLYVRLIGDSGDRVMVRVGGGWADLAEYLREYVTHHGRFADPESSTNNDSVPSFFKNLGRRIGSRSSRISKATASSSKGADASLPMNERHSNMAPARLSRGNGEEESLSLAGPSSRRSDLSADKQRWVEEMLNRAKRVSSGGTNALN